jgi:hypothetical protein
MILEVQSDFLIGPVERLSEVEELWEPMRGLLVPGVWQWVERLEQPVLKWKVVEKKKVLQKQDLFFLPG